VGIYICTTDVGNNRSRDGRGGKPGRNRWCATTIASFCFTLSLCTVCRGGSFSQKIESADPPPPRSAKLSELQVFTGISYYSVESARS
jgi:hypothetical protein